MTSNPLAIQPMNVTKALVQPLILLVFMATFSEEFPDLILCVGGSPPHINKPFSDASKVSKNSAQF